MPYFTVQPLKKSLQDIISCRLKNYPRNMKIQLLNLIKLIVHVIPKISQI